MKVPGGERIYFAKYCLDAITLYPRKTAFSEGRNGVWSSNFQRRGRSYAASVPSQTPEPQNPRKRLPRGERFAMVESFVKKYKSIHGGKLPTATIVRKEMGGGYYSIKNILQELEFKSKVCFSDNETKKSPEKEVHEEGDSLAESEVVSTAVGVQEDTQTSAVGNKLEAQGKSEAYASVETTLAQAYEGKHSNDGIIVDALHHSSDALLTEIHQFKDKNAEAYDQPLEVAEDGKTEIQGVQEKTVRGGYDFVSEKDNPSDGDKKTNEKLKHDVTEDVKQHSEKAKGLETKLEEENGSNFEVGRQHAVSQNPVDSGREEVEAKHHDQSPEDEKKSISSEKPTDAEPKKSNFWGNLKSLANGIVNIWRKL